MQLDYMYILFSCQIVVTKKNSTTGFLIRISAMIWQENPVLGKLKEYIRHLLCAYFYLFFRLNNVIKDWKTNKSSTYKIQLISTFCLFVMRKWEINSINVTVSFNFDRFRILKKVTCNRCSSSGYCLLRCILCALQKKRKVRWSIRLLDIKDQSIICNFSFRLSLRKIHSPDMMRFDKFFASLQKKKEK